ncbi:MAG: ABC transporter permease [Chloroflexota bacterium]
MRWQPLVILFFCATSLLAPILATENPMRTNLNAQLQPPGASHLLGTDVLGRDVFSRLLHGGRRTLLIASIATFTAVMVGGLLGLASGITNEFGNLILSGIITMLLAFPTLLVALVVLTILGIGPLSLALATGFSQIGAFGRISRTTAIRVRSQLYMESGYAIGATRWHMFRFYIFPNAQAALTSYAAITFSYCLLNSTTLSFLGLGGEPGVPDWGVMLAESRVALSEAPWLGIVPGLAITIVVWAIISWVNQGDVATFQSATGSN